MGRRTIRIYVLLALAATGLLVTAAPAAAKERLFVSPGDDIVYEGVAFEAPVPGGSVAFEELREDGAKYVQVETDAAGVVWGIPEVSEGDEFESAAATPACDDNTWTFWDLVAEPGVQDGKWYGQHVFAFRGDTVPDGLSAFNARNRVIDAFRNWENAVNNCGRADNINYDGALVGKTGNINVPGDGSGCNVTHDGKSAVGFGSVTGTALAFACVWSIPAPPGGNTDREIVEGDIKLDSSSRNWNAQDSAGSCSGNTFMVEAVATHEFGHMAIGLLHANPESEHGHLTMSPIIAPCSVKENTLGLGDMVGAEQNY